ncbi:hypothetical protein EVAR_99713_1 [Eumeta japonica]|uniref:Uncharacterized protein n=1 Tax=Eumeta variegata TaxID=151549 RepID=A0A4C1ZJW8_EUMVA|nr:hypothetical protein EVAR_99713_1 [Eumeta japonica]
MKFIDGLEKSVVTTMIYDEVKWLASCPRTIEYRRNLHHGRTGENLSHINPLPVYLKKHIKPSVQDTVVTAVTESMSSSFVRGSSTSCCGCRCGYKPMARTRASSQKGHCPLGLLFYADYRQPSGVRQLTPLRWKIWIAGLVGADILLLNLDELSEGFDFQVSGNHVVFDVPPGPRNHTEHYVPLAEQLSLSLDVVPGSATVSDLDPVHALGSGPGPAFSSDAGPIFNFSLDLGSRFCSRRALFRYRYRSRVSEALNLTTNALPTTSSDARHAMSDTSKMSEALPPEVIDNHWQREGLKVEFFQSDRKRVRISHHLASMRLCSLCYCSTPTNKNVTRVSNSRQSVSPSARSADVRQIHTKPLSLCGQNFVTERSVSQFGRIISTRERCGRTYFLPYISLVANKLLLPVSIIKPLQLNEQLQHTLLYCKSGAPSVSGQRWRDAYGGPLIVTVTRVAEAYMYGIGYQHGGGAFNFISWRD